MIEIENLRFAWPRAESDCLAIDRLSIAAGSTLVLYGPSGSGKSTLLGLLAGVLVARQGRVGVLDTDWSSLSGVRGAMHFALTMSATSFSSSTCCPT